MGIWLRIIACYVVVGFAWQANTEPDMSHYKLYQRTGAVVICIQPAIPHPQTEVWVDIAPDDLVSSAYFLTAVDTEGYESEPSNEAVCDQECQVKYLTPVIPRKITGVGLEAD